MLFLLFLIVRALSRVLAGGCNDGGTKDLEILVLRHQLRVLKRKAGRPKLKSLDRVLLAAVSQHASGPVGVVHGDFSDARSLAPQPRTEEVGLRTGREAGTATG